MSPSILATRPAGLPVMSPPFSPPEPSPLDDAALSQTR
jgi:hypothetical protein